MKKLLKFGYTALKLVPTYLALDYHCLYIVTITVDNNFIGAIYKVLTLIMLIPSCKTRRGTGEV